MGVHSLWNILGPTARPVKLDSLLRKKLAVDGSIWIYQFLKAVRDDKGDVLPHAHIVGFFRRICKLLYHGIYPVLVFDGGAPALKRETIRKRQDRRQGNRDTVNTAAKKLLAIQLQRIATGGSQPSRKRKIQEVEDSDSDEDQVYFEDLQNLNLPSKSPDKSKPFRREDDYHLPKLRSFKVSTDDTRIMPDEEYQDNFDFDMVDGININSIDPASKQFQDLPKPTQYMILSHLRLKSRLRMGFDKYQLEMMFPDEMEFSKFQIQQVQKRNFFTQRLMDISGMSEDGNVTRRVAGERDREYSLVRNDDGWTLSLVKDEGTSLDQPIMLEEDEDIPEKQDLFKLSNMKRQPSIQPTKEESDDSLSDFEEVPLKSETSAPVEQRSEQEQFLKSLYDQYEVPKIERPNSAGNIISPVNTSKSDGFSFANSLLAGPMESHFGSSDAQSKDRKESNENIELSNHANSLKMKTIHPVVLIADKGTEKRSLDLAFEQKRLNPPSSEESAQISPVSKTSNSSRIVNTLPVSEPNNKDKRNAVQTNGQKDDTSAEKDISAGLPDVIKDDAQIVVTISGNDVSSTAEGEDDGEKRKREQKQQNTMPQWFEEDFTASNPHQETAFTNSVVQNGADQHDEIIPWKEAREMLEQSESSEEESDIYEVEEIQDPSIVEQEVITIDDFDDKQEIRKPMVFDYDFEEDDEIDLVKQMNTEEADHEKFRQQLAGNQTLNREVINSVVTDEQLLQEQLQKAKRDSDEVTETMIKDVQELLRRFGIPYITAPMEAEAQCAELLKLKLVDGIITDDSDCFLFGGDRVYKNMFNQKQYVECYQMADIEGQLGLTQDRLIELALLLGSDYTEGVKGIGPVLGMEILAEFESVKAFKKWFDKNTQSMVNDDLNNTSLKKSLLSRIKNGKLFLSEAFPDMAISDAYKHPEVEHDDTEFKWGVPDLDQVRSYLMYNVKWSQQKVDDVMVPLIRDMNKRRSMQTTLEEFFPRDLIQTRKELAAGKRIKKAASRLTKK